MGFDLSITLNFRIDPKTGLPFVWGKDNSRMPYVPSEFEVPEKYRKWIQQRGHIFHSYIKALDKYGYSTDVYTFLDTYPDWDEVLKDIGPDDDDCDYWNESDHDDFREALEWFNEKSCFMVEWSY